MILGIACVYLAALLCVLFELQAGVGMRACRLVPSIALRTLTCSHA